jgi:peptidoglycan/xylan/chitin deacetylase (PgdA/CDA1 family)
MTLRLMFAGAAALLAAVLQPASAGTPQCRGTIYLTFDTGSQSQAELIAESLRRHNAKATFFLANEKTVRGDWSLDPSWAAFWKARVAEGHAFGSHTFDHVYYVKDGKGGKGGKGGTSGEIVVRPQFGDAAGRQASWDAAHFCDEIRRVDTRFMELTGHHLDPIWRAPGGKTSPRTLAAAQGCGYAHVGWSPGGFSGDELSSGRYPNALLLKQSLAKLQDGDIFMAHMGIWSRQDPWAPANLEPLLTGLERRGFCFATLREHPGYSDKMPKNNKTLQNNTLK